MTLPGQVEQFLVSVRNELDAETFESGQCHTLAGVLQELFGGELVAIMRNEVTEEGEVFSTTYSHMVCEIDRLCYDIDGPEADSRWCEKWSDEPDEDGLTSKFEFLEIPAHDLMTFIDKHAGIPIDAAVVEKLRGVVAQVMPEALATKNKPSLTMG